MYQIKMIDNYDDLMSSYRFRYNVFEPLGYISPNQSKMDIDTYDDRAVAFIVKSDYNQIISYVRLIVACQTWATSKELEAVVDSDMVLRDKFYDQKYPLPSINSDAILQILEDKHIPLKDTAELSRNIVDPQYRSLGLSRQMLSDSLIFARDVGLKYILGSCIPSHTEMYEKYGYEKIAEFYNDRVGQSADLLLRVL